MTTPKTALITGASRGIGKAIAYEFARNGYTLYLTCKNNIDLLKELKAEFGCHIFQCDMGNIHEVETLFQGIPSIDIIVNNAGISHVGLLTDMSEDDWRRVNLQIWILYFIQANLVYLKCLPTIKVR